jgi:ABC-type antimicrobial peptide transport system permease subunit
MSQTYHFFINQISNSFRSLLHNKKSSLLTMLGVIIGVASVIIIISIGDGAQSLILSQVKSLGSNVIGITPGKSEEKGPPAAVYGINITTLTYEDGEAIKLLPRVTAVSGYVRGSAPVTWRGEQYSPNLNGVTADYLTVEGMEIATGRFFTEAEERGMAKVAVIGYTAVNEIFGQTDPIGQTIKIKSQNYEIIGTLARRGTVAFQDNDNQIIVPAKTMQRLVAGVNHLAIMRIKIDNEKYLAEVMDNIRYVLRDRHDIRDQSGESDDFSVRSAAQALDMLTNITNALRFFLAAMASLSLIVGGVGIMNIMLVRVSSRTREIGLRKAVGATHRDIMFQFLVESSSITVSGGLIGIIIGELVSLLIAVIAGALGYDWQFSISIWSILLAFSVSIAVGLIFGLYPARKASRLSPIEALRYE